MQRRKKQASMNQLQQRQKVLLMQRRRMILLQKALAREAPKTVATAVKAERIAGKLKTMQHSHEWRTCSC